MNQLPFEPYKIKTVEPIRPSTRKQRAAWARQARYNVFALKAQQILIDLLTDSGTSAMSQRQWAGIMEGDESYAGSINFQNMERTIRSVTGFRHVIPTHQGRSAENLLFSAAVSAGQIVPNNTHFDTTGANVRLRGAEARNLPVGQAVDIDSDYPFKGNMDVAALDRLLEKEGTKKIPLVMITCTNNSAGGQPVSLANLRQTSEVCRRRGVPLFIDACRFAENAYFIKTRERGQRHRTVREIAREMFSLADGATMSAKKDALVNIGGFLATKNTRIAKRVKELMVVIEGFPTYGGLAGRDMEALSRGMEEGLDEGYLESRIGQIARMVDRLAGAGVPVLRPAGGHAVFLDAKRFCPHIPRDQFPGQALSVALYIEHGIRCVEIGGVMFAQTDPETGKTVYPKLELVRLAIPRRVYTDRHMDYVVDSIADLHGKKNGIRGLRFTYNPPRLRHFLARYDFA